MTLIFIIVKDTGPHVNCDKYKWQRYKKTNCMPLNVGNYLNMDPMYLIEPTFIYIHVVCNGFQTGWYFIPIVLKENPCFTIFR